MTYKEISIGARDGGEEESVKKLQQLLNQTGKFQLEEDGIFGVNTQKAVKTYQKANNLTVDGIVGQQTWESLTKTRETHPVLGEATEETYTPPTYHDYAKQLEELYDAWSEREPFSYEAESDPLYQQYRDLYTRQGHLAMLDTMGRAAALTGGYGNSYGQTAGQLAFQDYMYRLGQAIPELYGAAYDRYSDEGDRLLQKYTVTKELADTAYQREKAEEETAYQREQDALHWQKAEEETAYQREQDALKWQQAEEETAYQREQDALKWQQAQEEAAYQREQDALKWQQAQEETAYQRQQDELKWQLQEEETAYQRQQDELKWQQEAYQREQAEDAAEYERMVDNYNRLYKLLSYGYDPTDQELAAAGMSRSQADALLDAYYAQKTQSTKSTGSNAGSKVNNGNCTEGEIKAMQRQLGVTDDGQWGPVSQEAALKLWGTKDPDKAWIANNKMLQEQYDAAHNSRRSR